VRLETERLVLRTPRADDADDFFAVWGDETTTRFIGGPKTRDEVVAMIQRMDRHWERYGVGLFALERKEDGRALGRVGLLVWDPKRWVNGFRADVAEPLETEIGWTLGREHWGRGYATEAALACRDWALGELGLTRLISLIAHENVASIRVAEKLGESFERDVEPNPFRFPVGVWALGERMTA
jgi:RimJ/RimL family protein N-acetyltransferase